MICANRTLILLLQLTIVFPTLCFLLALYHGNLLVFTPEGQLSVSYSSPTEGAAADNYKTFVRDPAFNLHLDPHKKVVLLLTSFRSGSTFLGELFDSNPGMQYLYEPFHRGVIGSLYKRGHLVGARPHHTESDLKMLYLQQILHNCTVYKTVFRPEQYAFCGTPQEHLYRFNSTECDTSPLKPGVNHREICRYRNTTVMKVIRLRDLGDVMKIARIKSGNIKIIHLIRHPLPLMMSRRTGLIYFLWELQKYIEYTVSMKEHRIRFAFEAFNYCYHNLKSAEFAGSEPWLRDRYLRVTHRDMSLRPLDTAQLIYNFVGETLTEDVKKYIKSITSGPPPPDDADGKSRDALEFRKNSTEVVSAWRKLGYYLKYWDMFSIEAQCKSLFGQIEEDFTVDNISLAKIRQLFGDLDDDTDSETIL